MPIQTSGLPCWHRTYDPLGFGINQCVQASVDPHVGYEPGLLDREQDSSYACQRIAARKIRIAERARDERSKRIQTSGELCLFPFLTAATDHLS